MGKPDAITKAFVKDPVIFADVCNFVLGKNTVKADSLCEQSETEIASIKISDDDIDVIQKYRDVMKKSSIAMEDGKKSTFCLE